MMPFDPERAPKELLNAGWIKHSSTVWISPWGAYFRGPAQAYQVMQTGYVAIQRRKRKMTNSEWVTKLFEYVWVTNGTLLHNPDKMADIVAQIQNDAINGVEMIRCMKHRETPRINNAASGCECGYCAYLSGPNGGNVNEIHNHTERCAYHFGGDCTCGATVWPEDSLPELLPITIYRVDSAWIDETFYSMRSAEIVLYADHQKQMHTMAILLKNAVDAIELMPGGSVMKRVVTESREILAAIETRKRFV